MAISPNSRYYIPILSKAVDVLEFLAIERDALPLEEIYRRLHMPKSTVYRILQTLVHRGYIQNSSLKTYKYLGKPRKLAFGFACDWSDLEALTIARSVEKQSVSAGVELVSLNNEGDTDQTIQNVESFVRDGCDLVIQCRLRSESSYAIAAQIATSKLPMLSVDSTCSHSRYIGIDPYENGMQLGSLCATFVKHSWNAQVSHVIELWDPASSYTSQGRLAGTLKMLEGTLLCPMPIPRRIEGGADRDYGCAAIGQYLDQNVSASRVIVVASTDSGALGALDAARARGREADLAVVGKGSTVEAIAEICRPESAFIATSGANDQEYGRQIVAVGLAILQGYSVQPFTFVDQKVIAKEYLGVSLINLQRAAGAEELHGAAFRSSATSTKIAHGAKYQETRTTR